MSINFGKIEINKIWLKELEKTDQRTINKVYGLAAIKTMVPKNSKIARQIDMLIVNYLCKSQFGSFLTPDEKLISSRTYQKAISKLEKKYDAILEKDMLDEIYRASAPYTYFLENDMLRQESLFESLNLSLNSREKNLSVLALQFSNLFVTGPQSNYYDYSTNETQIINNEKERKRFLNNFKRAITGKKIKKYESKTEKTR